MTELEQPLAHVEAQLHALALALRANDAPALEAAAAGLHESLSSAVERFRSAARRGDVPAPLRQRLAIASARVAAQRLSLARATAALDRAIEVLMPSDTPTYAAASASARIASTGALLA
jgi:hypothetical protein